MEDFLENGVNHGVLYGGNSEINNLQASGAYVFVRNSVILDT
jgi:hypothetical protein